MTSVVRARLGQLGWDADLVIETVEESIGSPPAGHVTVEVEACGVCHRDCIDRDGRFPFIRIPITPGHETVGRITAVGEEVSDWAVGDRVGTMHRDFCGECAPCRHGQTSQCLSALAVLGLVIDGGYATHLVAPERCFFRLPDEMAAAEAAVLHCTFGTAYRGLKRFGRVQPGQPVLITGANGGVGTAAIQVAKRLGAHVTAVVRDERHQDALCGLGADAVVVDSGERFHKQLPTGTVDVALDCVGAPTFNASLRSLRPAGRLVVVGNVTQDKAALNLGYLITKGLEFAGSSGATRQDMRELCELWREQPFAVTVHERLELGQADRAQRMVRAGGLQGRIVLVPPTGG